LNENPIVTGAPSLGSPHRPERAIPWRLRVYGTHEAAGGFCQRPNTRASRNVTSAGPFGLCACVLADDRTCGGGAEEESGRALHVENGMFPGVVWLIGQIPDPLLGKTHLKEKGTAGGDRTPVRLSFVLLNRSARRAKFSCFRNKTRPAAFRRCDAFSPPAYSDT